MSVVQAQKTLHRTSALNWNLSLYFSSIFSVLLGEEKERKKKFIGLKAFSFIFCTFRRQLIYEQAGITLVVGEDDK